MTGSKRKASSDISDELTSKKQRVETASKGRLDPYFGQHSALPGLDDGEPYGSEDDVDHDGVDALEYLRSVRHEASSIPGILVAPRPQATDKDRDIYEDGIGDFRGKYEDGAYLAVADEHLEDDVPKDGSQHFNSILSRYENLREHVAQVPPAYVVHQLDHDHPTQVGPLNKNLTRWWIKSMRTQVPHPAQLACMNKSSVLRLLRLLTQGSLLKRGLGVDFGISYWAWSLLARLPDRGQLNSEEIGVVRELGKKAVLIGMSLDQVPEWQDEVEDVEAQFEENLGAPEAEVVNLEEIELDLEDEVVDPQHEDKSNITGQVQQSERQTSTIPKDSKSGMLEHYQAASQLVSADSQAPLADVEHKHAAENDQDLSEGEILSDAGDVEDAALAAKKAQMIGKLVVSNGEVSDESHALELPISRYDVSKLNSKATVDMIITIAGEVYGQRDLLEFRGQWAHIM